MWMGVCRAGIPLPAPPASARGTSLLPRSRSSQRRMISGRGWAQWEDRAVITWGTPHESSVTTACCSSPLPLSLHSEELSLSRKVSSQVRAGVKRGFPPTVCLLQKKMTQFLPSPFRTILHPACHRPACSR